MQLKAALLRLMLLAATLLVGISAIADDLITPIPITADEAFDAVQTQTDPLDPNLEANVVLVDVRTRAEYYWVGAAAAVTEIVRNDGKPSISPENGKVRLSHEGKFLDYNTIDGKSRRLQVAKVEKLEMSPIAINIPFRLWDEETVSLVPNLNFVSGIQNLINNGAQILILFCRTGGRSSTCAAEIPTADVVKVTVYEIDDYPPEDPSKGGYGGFEGSTYNNAYNGYVGFPGRLTEVQDTPSVSWKDSGLPMETFLNPLTP